MKNVTQKTQNETTQNETQKNVFNFELFREFKQYDAIVDFIKSNQYNFFKLTQIASILKIDAKIVRQRFRKTYALFDQTKLPRIIDTQNNNEKWHFAMNEKTLYDVLKIANMRNVKIEMQLMKNVA